MRQVDFAMAKLTQTYYLLETEDTAKGVFQSLDRISNLMNLDIAYIDKNMLLSANKNQDLN